MEKETVAPIVDTWHERVPEDGVLNETWHDRRNQEIASKTWAERCRLNNQKNLQTYEQYAETHPLYILSSQVTAMLLKTT